MNWSLKEIEGSLDEIQNRVENNSSDIEEIVNSIISPYCTDLDNYVKFIRECLKDGENPVTTAELEDFCMNLSTYIYFAGGLCENLGVRDDIAKAIYREQYNTTRNSLEKGTVADKDALASLYSQKEFIISASYTRAYKTMKSKVEAAQELLSSCKKVLTHRIQELELTKLGGSGN